MCERVGIDLSILHRLAQIRGTVRAIPTRRTDEPVRCLDCGGLLLPPEVAMSRLLLVLLAGCTISTQQTRSTGVEAQSAAGRGDGSLRQRAFGGQEGEPFLGGQVGEPLLGGQEGEPEPESPAPSPDAMTGNSDPDLDGFDNVVPPPSEGDTDTGDTGDTEG